MNILTLGKIIVLHNNKKGNNYLTANIIADHFKCNTITAEDNPCLLNYDTIIIVLSNIGDEELPQPMEDYLFSLKIKRKNYLICELGNYFGFENYSGCKKVAFKILNNLKWTKISDISLDSLPKLDLIELNKWLENFK